jgi:hypothetical protein
MNDVTAIIRVPNVNAAASADLLLTEAVYVVQYVYGTFPG